MNKIILLLLAIYASYIPSFGQINSSTSFFFGHSLIDHRPPLIETPSDETTVPHWLQLLSNHANKDFAVSGKFGFLPQHATQPVFSQWGYDIVNSAWESDYETFAEADFTNIIITAANFIQFQAHTENYVTDPGISPLSATLDIIDYVTDQEDSLKLIIYENWPDMAQFAPDFPPSTSQLEAYYDYTSGEFNDWWINYHNDLDANRPDLQIKMIPIGPIFADLFTNSPLQDIPVLELYEDNAPHGRASLYFLASLITYVGLYEEQPALDYEIPSIVHPIIIDNYALIINRIWDTCLSFNFEDGRSRVFTQNIVSNIISEENNAIHIYPNPSFDKLNIESNISDGLVRFWNTQNVLMKQQRINKNIDISFLNQGIYFVEIINSKGEVVAIDKLIKL